jgi:hypothetical protein
MTKKEFVSQYIEKAAAKGMANAVLPDQDLPLEQWRSLWERTLNQPAI